MDSSWQTLIDITTDQSSLRYTTSEDADPVLAVGYLLDNMGWHQDYPPSSIIVQNHGDRVTLKYEDIRVDVRKVQHWPEIDFIPEHAALAAQLREQYPHRRQIVERV